MLDEYRRRAARRLRMPIVRPAFRTFEAYRRWRSSRARSARSPMPIGPLADLFPDSLASIAIQREQLNVAPERDMVLHGDARSFSGGRVELPEVRTVELSDALFDPLRNLVLSRDGTAIAGESVGYPDEHNGHVWPPERSELPKAEIRVRGTVSSFRCFLYHGIYYHTLMDGIPRMYPFVKRRLSNEIRFLVTEPVNPAEQYFFERLAPPGASLLVVPNDVLVRAERFVHVDFVAPADVGILHDEVRGWLSSMLLPTRPRQPTHRIYVRRGDVGTRRILNEAQLEGRLKELGFRSYELGRMSPSEQIELFYDAELVVSAHGSGLTNLLFAMEAGVVELFNSPFVRPHYWCLCQQMGHRYAFVYGDRLRKNDDFWVPIDEVVQQIDAIAGGMRSVSRTR